jgi:hypothetical protein
MELRHFRYFIPVDQESNPGCQKMPERGLNFTQRTSHSHRYSGLVVIALRQLTVDTVSCSFDDKRGRLTDTISGEAIVAKASAEKRIDISRLA